MSEIDDALEFFAQGYGCSQAVLAAYAPALGLDLRQAMRLSAPFSAPLCPDGLCGALSGALMVLSQARGAADCLSAAARSELRAFTDELSDGFRDRFGSIVCRDIVGADLRTAAGMAQAREGGLITARCTPALRGAVELLADLLARSAGES